MKINRKVLAVVLLFLIFCVASTAQTQKTGVVCPDNKDTVSLLKNADAVFVGTMVRVETGNNNQEGVVFTFKKDDVIKGEFVKGKSRLWVIVENTATFIPQNKYLVFANLHRESIILYEIRPCSGTENVDTKRASKYIAELKQRVPRASSFH